MPALRSGMQKPTEDEWKVLRAVETASQLYGNPTVEEIAQAAVPPLSRTTAYRLLRRLAAKGWIAHPAKRARSIRLLRPLVENLND